MSSKKTLVRPYSLYNKTYEILTYQIMNLCRQLDHDKFLTADRKDVKLSELQRLITQRNCLIEVIHEDVKDKERFL